MEIIAVDVNKEPPEDVTFTYFRLTKEMKEFLELCEKKHGIVGFRWDKEDSFNFGLIIKKDVKENYER